VTQVVDAHAIVVPTQLLPEQASLYVQAFESSHAAAVRQAQLPPALVQRYVEPPQVIDWHNVWLDASHSTVDPAPQVPLALLVPQPEQARPVVTLFEPQVSAQDPAAVPQPEPPLHVTVQHWSEPPTWQVVGDALHEQVLHPPDPSQYLVQVPG